MGLPLHAAIITIAFAFLLFSCALSSNIQSVSYNQVQPEVNEGQRRKNMWRLTEELQRVARSLIGPGSSPPSCRSKCGRCAPCRAVHIPIQPGLNKPLEYYPEAWRCKCGNGLFMP